MSKRGDPVRTLYTIGYAGFDAPGLIRVLKDNGVGLVVDVRSEPFSSYYSQFDRDRFSVDLNRAGIYYRSYASEFGARQTDALYADAGYVDFELFSRSEPFRAGIDRLVESMRQGWTFALMCAEKDPMECHRFLMVAREFDRLGYQAIHLLSDGSSQTQKETEQRLIAKHFPGGRQLSLFAESGNAAGDMLQEAYRRQNRLIARRPPGAS